MFKRIIGAFMALFAFASVAKAQSTYDYNSLATAYITTTISQSVVFDSTMQQGGTFDFSVLAHNGGGRAGQSDTANVKIEFYNASNVLITSANTSYNANLPNPNAVCGNPCIDAAVPWTTLSISKTLTAAEAANVSYAKVYIYGIDGSYWAGDYGPWYRAPTLSLNNGGNLLYNPEFGPYNGVNAQGWSVSPALGACQGAWGGSNACIVDNTGTPGRNTTGLVANANGGGPSATGGTTSGTAGGYSSTLSTTNTTPTATPTPTPTPAAPTVVSTAPGTPTITSTSTQGTVTQTSSSVAGTTITSTTTTRGTPVITTSFADTARKDVRNLSITRTTTVFARTPLTVVTTYTTPITTTVVTHTPTIVTTTTTPNTVTTWSDGTTTTTAGTPVTTTTTTVADTPVTTTTNQVATLTTYPMDIQTTTSNATQTVKANGMSNAVSFRNHTLVMGSPLDRADGGYAQPYGMRQGAHGGMTYQGGTFGYQNTVENNIWGFNIDISHGESKTKDGNSYTQGDSYNGSAYILTKQDYFWYKGQVGVASSYYTNGTSIPAFALSAKNKAHQMNLYTDNTVYSPVDFYGFRPFAGALINNSSIDKTSTTGSQLLNLTPDKKSTTFGIPYAGLRYEFDKNVSVEYRASQSPDFKTVHGVRASVKKEIDKDVYLDFTLGSEKGSRGYTNTYGMVGLVWKF